MATYFTAFQEQVDGTTPPTGWTSRWHTAAGWQALADAVFEDGIGVRANFGSFARYLSHDATGSVGSCEIFIRVRSPNIDGQILAVVHGSSNTGAAYPAANVSGVFVRCAHNNDFRITRQHDGGAFVEIDTISQVGIAPDDTWLNVRFRAEVDNPAPGTTTYRAKIWADGAEEPAAWTLEGTDTQYSAGLIGLGADGSDLVYFDRVGIATAGDTAPIHGDPSAPGAFTSPLVDDLVVITMDAAWGASTHPESATAVTYRLELSEDGGASYLVTLASGLTDPEWSGDVTSYVGANCKLRVRAEDDDGQSVWVESGVFEITNIISPENIRDIDVDQRALLRSDHYRVHAVLKVENGAGVLVDYSNFEGINWFLRGNWREDVDSGVAGGQVELFREVNGVSLMPLMAASTANRDAGGAYAPALYVARDFEIWVAITLPGVSDPGAALTKLVEGRTMLVDFTSSDSAIILDLADPGAWLQQYEIKTEVEYGEPGGPGIPIQTLMQSILDDHPARPGVAAPTLRVLGDPAWNIRHYVLEAEGMLYDKLRDLAHSIGWDMRYRWTREWGYCLCLWEPYRDVVDAYTTFDGDEYLSITEAKIDDASVRNDIELDFENESGEREQVVAVNAVSQDQFGYRYMKMTLASGDPIGTTVEAQRLVDTVSSDLGLPQYTHGIELRHWPWTMLGDYYGFLPNGTHYDEEQRGAVQTFEHTWEDGGGFTSIMCSAKPRGAYKAYLTGGKYRVIDTQTAPRIRIAITDSTPTSITYEVTAASPTGLSVILYVAVGSGDFVEVVNPYTLVMARSTVDQRARSARVRAINSKGETDDALIQNDFDFVPGFSYDNPPQPLYADGEQAGWLQQVGVDDDCRAIRVEILSGEATFDGAFPVSSVTAAGYGWVDTSSESNHYLRFLQSPGKTAVVELTPCELYDATGATPGALGRPIRRTLQMPPVTTLNVKEKSASVRTLTFTPNPAGCTLFWKVGDAAWQSIASVDPSHAVDVNVAASDVTIEWYSVSADGIAERANKLVIDRNKDPNILGFEVSEGPANNVNVALTQDEDVLRWELYGSKTGWPTASGTVSETDRLLPDYLIDTGQRGDGTSSFYFVTGNLYLVARAFDFKGAYTTSFFKPDGVNPGAFVVAGVATGQLTNVAVVRTEDGASDYHDISYGLDDELLADLADYTIDIKENDVQIVTDRAPETDITGSTAEQGSYRRQMVFSTEADTDAHKAWLTFTYDVILKHLGTVVRTHRVTVSGWYLGSGIYAAAPATTPAITVAALIPDPPRSFRVTLDANPGHAVDIQFVEYEGVGGPPDPGLPDEVNQVLTSGGTMWFKTGAVPGNYYWARARFWEPGGAGAWCDWAGPAVPYDEAGGGGLP